MINLFAPYERRTVQLVGDTQALEVDSVRAIVVQLQYSFFDEQRRPQIVFRPGESLEDKMFEITLPLDQYEYDYAITWIKHGGQRLFARGMDSSGLIFIDEMPETE